MYKYFQESELKCKCGKCKSKGHEMSVRFMNKLDVLRGTFDKPLILTSAYRCPKYNSVISSTGLTGAHTTGHAVDISVRGSDALSIIKIALDLGFTGIGVKQKGAARFIHLDDLDNDEFAGFSRPMIWSY